MAQSIFISYSREDEEFAFKLAKDLEALDFKVWIDNKISGGERWRHSLDHNLRSAHEMIVVVSPYSAASKWVTHETSFALGADIHVVPVLIENVPRPDRPVYMDQLQYVDFRGWEKDGYAVGLEALTKVLTPPNYAQDVLENQLKTFKQTGELLSKGTLGFIEEATGTFELDDEAKELVQKSKKALIWQQWKNRLRDFAFTLVVAVVATLGVTGQLNRFIYRPLDMKDYWVKIPAGEFVMGSEDGEADEHPVHTVYLDDYLIGRYEVTNRQFAQCIKAGVCQGGSLEGGSLEDVEPKNPVVLVSWDEAQTFCEWVGGRLPTEAEWEKAARGGLEGMLYPWGNQAPTCEEKAENGAQFDGCGDSPVPVGSFGANGYGLYDMAGNVWEWVADIYNNDFYTPLRVENPVSLDDGVYRVERGGSWLANVFSLRVANRLGAHGEKFTYSSLGFRCATSPDNTN
jgi:formylglycine-generating enzyme required for sulfatase activity